MTNATLDKLIWTLIYGGLLALGLGLFVRRQDAGVGLGIVSAGLAIMAVGVLLFWLRSRRRPE